MIAKKKKVIDSFVSYLASRYKIRFFKWEPNKKAYPEYLFLKGDRGILAYIKFYVFEKEAHNLFDISTDLREVTDTIKHGYSELDRPIFLIYIFDINGKYEAKFETDEQIRDRIQNDCSAIDLHNNKYYPNPETFGNLNNLLTILFQMREKGVII